MSRTAGRALLVALLGWTLVFGAEGFAAPLPAEIEQELALARQAGLPTAGLAAKASEGLAKGVSPARVASVLAGMREDLQSAESLLGPLPAGPERDRLLGAAAGALHAGASPAAVRALQDLPSELRAPALDSLGDLLSLSFGEDVAVGLIRDAARAPGGAVRMSDLAHAAAALLASGLSHEAAITAVEESTRGRPEDKKNQGKGNENPGKDNKGGGKK